MHADIVGRAASGCDNKVQDTQVLGEFQPQLSNGGEVCGSVSEDVQSRGCMISVLCQPVYGIV